MESKLKPEDIVLLNEGQQVKKKLEKKYDSLKNFYETEKQLGISLKSIRNYCCSRRIMSETFKISIVKCLDEDWCKIVINEAGQIKNFVNEIYKKIRLYKEDKDYALLEKVRALCVERKLINENALMLRCLAKHFYMRNNIIKAFSYYNEILRIINNNSLNDDTFITIMADIAEFYYMEKEIKEAEKFFIQAQDCIEKSNQVSNTALYKYYFRRGIILNSEGRHSEARSYIEKSIQYAGENTELNSDKGATYMAIGSTYKREGIYDKAKEYYFMSLLEFHIEDINGRTLALNNIADIYCILKDYEAATKYIESAISLLDKDSTTYSHLIVAQTHAEIKLMVEDTSACYEYFDILKKTVNTSIDKKDIRNKIISIINYIDDIDLLKELYYVIAYIKDNTDNYVYADDLYSCMGRICEKINNRVSGKFLIV